MDSRKYAPIMIGAWRTERPVERLENKAPKNTSSGMRDAQSHICSVSTFFLPDYTVGSGISPDHARLCSRAVPPIGN
jgi:hypothetical protein